MWTLFWTPPLTPRGAKLSFLAYSYFSFFLLLYFLPSITIHELVTKRKQQCDDSFCLRTMSDFGLVRWNTGCGAISYKSQSTPLVAKWIGIYTPWILQCIPWIHAKSWNLIGQPSLLSETELEWIVKSRKYKMLKGAYHITLSSRSSSVTLVWVTHKGGEGLPRPSLGRAFKAFKVKT